MLSPEWEQFRRSFAKAHAVAQSLAYSLRWMLDRAPLEAAWIADLDEDGKAQIDAFIHRFSKLQDMIGAQLFRGILTLEREEERHVSMLDVLNAMKKRRTLESVDDWDLLRRIRHNLSHEYPDDPGKAAADLTDALLAAPLLLGVLNRLQAYAQDKKLADLSDFVTLEGPPAGQ